MEIAEFTLRLARVRERFATALTGKLDDSYACIPKLPDKDAAAIETIIVMHRRLHEMCGIAPSVGFPATGKAARAAEAVLRDPAKFRRSLTAAEVASFTTELDGLRAATQSDLQTSSS